MIINAEKKSGADPLDDGALDTVAGGYIIPGTGRGSPYPVPDTVIDDRTLEVVGQADSIDSAVKIAQGLGVSTERITWVEYENMKNRRRTQNL